METPRVIFLDEHLLVIDKPSGMPSEPTKLSAFGTATAWAEQFLRQQKRDTSFIAAAHRLDTPTSGLLCIGLSKNTAGALQTQFSAHSAQRMYLAIVDGLISWETKQLTHRIELDKSRSFSSVVAAPKGKEAKSMARVLQRSEQRSCVLLQPQTGLTHQLRVQLQAEGHPIIGDSRYGSAAVMADERLSGARRTARPRTVHSSSPEHYQRYGGGAGRIALHALSLSLRHPKTGKDLWLEAPPPESFWSLWC